jgi:hypothetical protein
MYKVWQEAVKRDEAAINGFSELKFPTDPELRLGRDSFLYGITEGKQAGAVRKDDKGKVTIWLSGKLMSKYNYAMDPVGTIGGRMTTGENHPITNKPFVKGRFDFWLKGHHQSEYEKLTQLFETAFNTAGPEGVNVVQLRRSVRDTIDTYREEWTHGWQRRLAGGDMKQLFDTDVFQKLHDAMPKGMKEYLDTHYAKASMESKVIEATAKTICKKPEKHGMSQDEAIDYAFTFFQEIHKKYGPEAFEHLTTAYMSMKDLKELAKEL